MSTRAVDDLVAAMGIDTGISKSEVSRICAGLDERVGAFRNRTLGHTTFPYVYLDATYVNVRDDALGQVVSRAVVVATGITAQGNREVLGVDIGNSEDETFWTRFLAVTRADDVQHGIAGVSLAPIANRTAEVTLTCPDDVLSRTHDLTHLLWAKGSPLSRSWAPALLRFRG